MRQSLELRDVPRVGGHQCARAILTEEPAGVCHAVGMAAQVDRRRSKACCGPWAADARLGERYAQPAVGQVARRSQQGSVGRISEEMLQCQLGGEVDRRRRPTDGVERLRPIRATTEVATRFAEEEDGVTGRAKMTRHRLGDIGEETDHADGWGRIDRAMWILVVERHITAGDRRSECATGVGDAAT